MSATLDLTRTLISRASVTPDDAGCQQVIGHRLMQLKFRIEPMRFGEVDNLWARHGTKGPLVVFAGHTDVVPSGPREAWDSDPFHPTRQGDLLYGRGAADMKSGLAAMVVAVENFIHKNANYPGSIAFLITSDEEGPSVNGTAKVIDALTKRHEKIDYCIIGEASSEKTLGDQIRIGRRGSLHGKLIVHGKQGHIAYPHLANNPIHACFNALHALSVETWDKGNEFFPPTSFQFSNIHSGTGAKNVIPGKLEVLFNFRFSTAVTIHELQERTAAILNQHKLNFSVEWEVGGYPFLTQQGKLIQTAQQVIKDLTGQEPILSTGGGTSDGRFIAPTGAEVIEVGPINESVHQVNEHVNISDLDKLTQIYQQLLEKLFY
jgi:succinyl-diaminopimelate desuccinylase